MSVSSIAVVGAGPRGLSIAEAAAEADMPVTVYCVTAARREHARRRLERTLTLRVDIGEIGRTHADEILERVSFTRDLSEATEADLVIESAVGDVRARRALLATIEMRLSRGSVLASNATRAQLEALAEVLVRQDQFLGLRFFHPATHTPLVELMPLPETAPGAVGACQAFCRWLRKTPVERVDGDVRAVRHSDLPKAAGGRR